MDPTLRDQIDVWLREQPDWVSAAEICSRFNVSERQLRADRDRKGLCTDFAISGDKGFRHLRHASAEEFEAACGRIVSHLKHEAARVRGWRERRRHELVGLRPGQQELFTGQRLLPV